MSEHKSPSSQAATRPHFRCATCGVTSVEEDGTCRQCGADTQAVYPAAPSSQATGEAPTVTGWQISDHGDAMDRICGARIRGVDATGTLDLEDADGGFNAWFEAAPSSSPALSGQTKDDEKNEPDPRT